MCILFSREIAEIQQETETIVAENRLMKYVKSDPRFCYHKQAAMLR